MAGTCASILGTVESPKLVEELFDTKLRLFLSFRQMFSNQNKFEIQYNECAKKIGLIPLAKISIC